MNHKKGSAPETSLAVELRNVTVKDVGVVILNNISLQVARGERLLITGPSGSGKTTILRTLLGLEKPAQGNVCLLGESVGGMSGGALANFKRQHVGIGFQSHNLDEGLSVLDNMIGLAGVFGHGKKTVRRAGELADVLGIADKLQQPTATLSGGEKFRVGLGRLLVPAPELLLLDEPTSAIDSKGKTEIFDLIDSVAGPNATIVMVSHDSEAHSLASQVLYMSNGVISEHPVVPDAQA